MTRNSTNNLTKPFDDPERAFHSLKRLFNTKSFDLSSSLELDYFSKHEEASEEEEIPETMTNPTMEEYMNKTRADYGSGVARPKFEENAKFELKGQFLKELLDNTSVGRITKMLMNTWRRSLKLLIYLLWRK
jgi:hypothetical protein